MMLLMEKASIHDYVPIGATRQGVRDLVAHYGGLLEVAGATGIPYRTLQGILRKGKYKRVRKATAEKVSWAVANPPEYKRVYRCSYCGRGLGRTKGPYCSAAHREARLREAWDRRFIDIERFRPLVDFLQRTYGTMAKAAEASGIPVSTLNNVKYDNRMRGLKRETAIKLVEFVMAHRRPTWTLFDSHYENEELPRFVTDDEKKYLRSMAGWDRG